MFCPLFYSGIRRRRYSGTQIISNFNSWIILLNEKVMDYTIHGKELSALINNGICKLKPIDGSITEPSTDNTVCGEREVPQYERGDPDKKNRRVTPAGFHPQDNGRSRIGCLQQGLHEGGMFHQR
jgi:hypothetical protein